jgi:hypothetical protein
MKRRVRIKHYLNMKTREMDEGEFLPGIGGFACVLSLVVKPGTCRHFFGNEK